VLARIAAAPHVPVLVARLAPLLTTRTLGPTPAASLERQRRYELNRIAGSGETVKPSSS
jgi:hypothetical protein